jgi:hypothetical protein
MRARDGSETERGEEGEAARVRRPAASARPTRYAAREWEEKAAGLRDWKTGRVKVLCLVLVISDNT